jgi:DNA invertase Pin-like site-specific DNA recombinase
MVFYWGIPERNSGAEQLVRSNRVDDRFLEHYPDQVLEPIGTGVSPVSSFIGYARVSTEDQDCAIQEAALRAAGCTVIRSEKKSGTSREGRTELETVLSFLRAGDSLVVTRIDRLARSLLDLEGIVRELRAKNVHLKALEQPVGTATPAGKAFLQMLGVFAEFETALRRERQMEGIAKAKAAGVYKGRKPSVPVEEVCRLKDEGVPPSEIAKRLGVGRTSVYRALGMVE